MIIVSNFFRELRRRGVFGTTAIYVVAAWLLVQVASEIFPAFNIPEFAIRYVWIGVALCFPLALIVGWMYDISPHGIKRTPQTGSDEGADTPLMRFDFLVLFGIAVVAAGLVFILLGKIINFQEPALVQTTVREVNPNSIAVLPLENLSGDPEQQYFVLGMQDALIAGLSRISALKVTSKTSTMRYRDTVLTIPTIAAQLGVAKLIEGTIYRVGDRVRISVKLVDAKSDAHIWTKTFEKEVKDVMMLQNEVALAIAQQVEVTITPVEKAQLKSARSVNPAAYQAFLKGQFHVERFTPQDMTLAAQYYQQAMQLDPNYALAYVGLSKLCGFQAQAGLIAPEEARERCLPPIQKALKLDDSLPEAHLSYAAHMTWQRFKWEEAEAAFKRAIKLNPSYAEARMFYSHFLTLVGLVREGSEQMRLALELDPLNPFVQGLHGAQLMMANKNAEAIKVIENVLASTPGFGFGYIATWDAYHVLGEKDKAIAAAANYFRITQGDPTGALALEEAYIGGDYTGALLHAAEVLAEHSKTVYVPPMLIGMLYEQAGAVEKAIDWFEIAYRDYDPNAPYMGVLTKSPAVHSNPRFIRLLRDLKLDNWADKYSQPD